MVEGTTTTTARPRFLRPRACTAVQVQAEEGEGLRFLQVPLLAGVSGAAGAAAAGGPMGAGCRAEVGGAADEAAGGMRALVRVLLREELVPLSLHLSLRRRHLRQRLPLCLVLRQVGEKRQQKELRRWRVVKVLLLLLVRMVLGVMLVASQEMAAGVAVAVASEAAGAGTNTISKGTLGAGSSAAILSSSNNRVISLALASTKEEEAGAVGAGAGEGEEEGVTIPQLSSSNSNRCRISAAGVAFTQVGEVVVAVAVVALRLLSLR
jgi:hypothetical protein